MTLRGKRILVLEANTLALAALPAMHWAPLTASLPSVSKPGVNRYHNERLKQDRLARGPAG
jgi:hypothetical protein